jgi:hypothetical protein
MTPTTDLLDDVADLLADVRPALLTATHPRGKELASRAHSLGRQLDQRLAPDPGAEGLLAALQRDGRAEWHRHGYLSPAAAKKALQRAGATGLRVQADGTVRRARAAR